jgi:hypothetical protein
MSKKILLLLAYLKEKVSKKFRLFGYKIIFPRKSRYQEVKYFNLEVSSDISDRDKSRTFSEFAIIIQGPLNESSRYLPEIIERYFELYPGIMIVVSTWAFPQQGKFRKNFEAIKGKFPKSFFLLTSEPIENSGISNVNSQIHTTRAGLAHCIRLNIRYVLKTRTDQSFNNPKFLLKLERAYEEGCKSSEPMPIVVSSKNSFLFRPYSISDMMQFSDIHTLLNFWKVEYDSRKSLEEVSPFPSTLSGWSQQRFAEVYLVTAYLESQGEILDFSLKHYHECLVKYFRVVDSDSIGHYWVKYSIRTNTDAKLFFPYPKYEISEFDYAQISSGKDDYFFYEEKIVDFWR